MDNQKLKLFLYALCLLLCNLLLTSCSPVSRYEQAHDGTPTQTIDPSTVPNAKPKIEAKSKYGNSKTYVVRGKKYHVLTNCKGYEETGIASWYGTKFHHHLTSNRETYDMFKMTAAHKTLPLPSYVKVTNLKNHKNVIVKVNDRGPFEQNRIIDLSYVAAKKLGVLAHGTAAVKIVALDPHDFCETPKTYIAKNKNNARFIQIGAYQNHENAIKIAMQISKNTDIPYIIDPAIVNDKPIFRVKLGPVPKTANLENLRAQITSTDNQKKVA